MCFMWRTKQNFTTVLHYQKHDDKIPKNGGQKREANNAQIIDKKVYIKTIV